MRERLAVAVSRAVMRRRQGGSEGFLRAVMDRVRVRRGGVAVEADRALDRGVCPGPARDQAVAVGLCLVQDLAGQAGRREGVGRVRGGAGVAVDRRSVGGVAVGLRPVQDLAEVGPGRGVAAGVDLRPAKDRVGVDRRIHGVVAVVRLDPGEVPRRVINCLIIY